MEHRYIPLVKTMRDIQKLLIPSVLKGKLTTTSHDIIQVIQQEPEYNIDLVVKDVTSALVADNEKTNCITGDGTEHVVVTREKLDQIIKIIQNGGELNARKSETDINSWDD